MGYSVGEDIKFLVRTGYYLANRKIEKGTIVKKKFRLFGRTKYYIELNNKEVIIIYKKDIIRSYLPMPKSPIPMPKCKPPKDDNIKELYNWLKGERYGYFLEDHKTWINYGELDDKFPYDESEKKWELSMNRMIEKTLRKMKELELIREE